MEALAYRLVLGIQIVAVFVLVALLVLWPSPWTPERIVGSALAMVGLALGFTARYQLGRSFSITPQARKLVTHGLYSKIRNPIYVFGLLVLAGCLLAFQVRRGWILLVAVVAMQTVRARREARVLKEKFGEEYRQYRSRIWF